jgi:hypothetical protein
MQSACALEPILRVQVVIDFAICVEAVEVEDHVEKTDDIVVDSNLHLAVISNNLTMVSMEGVPCW